MEDKNNSLALITGASSGIGKTFAKSLASQGFDLIIIARREELLHQLSKELINNYSVEIEVIPADLSIENDLMMIEKRIKNYDNISMLINNAGFGTRGTFDSVDIDKSVNMIKVHIIASVRLIKAIIPQMINRNSGTIINVSTITADIANPYITVYTATKAFLNIFSKSLDLEMKQMGINIKIQALCPGLTKTNFFSTKEWNFESADKFFNEFNALSSEEVVEESLESLTKDEIIVIPGLKNRQLHSLMIKEGKSWEEAAEIVYKINTSVENK